MPFSLLRSGCGSQYIALVRIALVVVLVVSTVAWANPPVAPPAKLAKPVVAPKPEPKKPEPVRLEHRIETRKADAAVSTLTLNAPKKKPARRVTLPDWTP